VNKRSSTIVSALHDIGAAPLVLADVGARGELLEPWRTMDATFLEVVGFEPDELECARLNAEGAVGRTFFPYALWLEQGSVEVHLADVAACSSIHPPNFELLENFAPRHADPRRTERIVHVPATTLDAFAREHAVDVDFLKIDTQGSELEILAGARDTLERDVVGALVETWTLEVHRGQHLTGEVLTLMNTLGFELFDVGLAAAWRRRVAEQTRLYGKAQVVGLDLLFFKRPLAVSTTAKAARLAATAALFGYPDFALEAASPGELEPLRRAIVAAANPRAVSLRTRIGKLVRARSDGQVFAPLH
jgi:FkbM family methyltransferase